MSYINIDSRGCGAGKTTGEIYARIRDNVLHQRKTLVVVSSKTLQKQYATGLGLVSDFVIINGDTNTDSVNEQLSAATKLIVCITHQGFLISNHRDTYNTDLIIDEAFDPYDSVTFNTHTDNEKSVVDLKSMIEWKTPEVVPDERPTESPQPFYELTFSSDKLPHSVSKQLRDCQNPNKRLWCTWETYNNLKNNVSETTTIHTEYDAYKLLGSWASVWIAAGLFEKTLMGAWLDMSALADVEVRYEFEKHDGAMLNIHRPQGRLSFSKHFINNDTSNTIEQFQAYITATRRGAMYYNVNNKSDIKFDRAQPIAYNAHGMNSYSQYTEYAFAIAIKPRNDYKSFIKQRTDMDNNAFEFAFTGYNAYQLVMRSRLRVAGNTSIVNVYFLDTVQANVVGELFNDAVFVNIPLVRTPIPRKARGPSFKKVAMTKAEKQKAYRERKKANK
jgi:hypothetical protein